MIAAWEESRVLLNHKFVRLDVTLVLTVLTAALLFGGFTVFAQGESSSFYSSYDAGEPFKKGTYKGINFDYGGAGSETAAELRDGGFRNSKDGSCGFRVVTTGDNKFDLTAFLKWLMQETKKQIESSKASVIKEASKDGQSFSIEYRDKEFKGEVEIEGKIEGRDRLNLNVKVTESNEK